MGGFAELGHFNKHFIQKKKTRKKRKAQEKKGPVGKHFLRLHFENLITIRAFYSKVMARFLIFKKRAEEASLLFPSCMPVSVSEYASVSLDIPKYP